MACNGSSTCQSGCFVGGDEEPENGEIHIDRMSSLSVSTPKDGRTSCPKCGEETAPQNPSPDGGLCLGCFRASLFGKFKLAVTANSMISPSDNVLVAFSGGPSSRVALQFVHEMQCKAQKNFDASRDRALPVFGVGVAFIDESSVSSINSDEVREAIREIGAIVSVLAPPVKELHVGVLESACFAGSDDGRERLSGLLGTIGDVTGRDDFMRHLRMLSLQKIALENGYNRLVLGSCTSNIACHVISATVKGQGYSLPADVQYVDGRWEVPVVFPLRDCPSRELSLLCQLDELKTQRFLDRPSSGINGLVSSFLARLQEENPSRERTIVRTAEKLTPFSFNKIPETESNDILAARRRRRAQSAKREESIHSEVLCPVCSSPLDLSESQSLKTVLRSCPTRDEAFAAHCCQSCILQILPNESSKFSDFYSLLPQPMTERAKDIASANQTWLREQIKDCLLSDNEEGT
ncbi:Cytoplasmic tRNA 2-thiolation protein 2 [Acorus gramineus]|uniref:Cytoplasmic tRNA 2-thiolation protein 2 n=1 Tax=Acorus gramineus TaxID=55184 RepID=A0AAV9BJD9_ACOGR|nr:Cytoplasmic tRNA 2-thiolation protein 2 [Acorus gramineus]